MSFDPSAPLPVQRTDKGIQFERYRSSVDDIVRGMDSASQEKAAKWNLEFLRAVVDRDSRYSASAREELSRNVEGLQTRAITPAGVHVDSVLATMSVMYTNDEMIGDRLMPVVPVGSRSGIYYTYDKRDRLAVPDDRIGVRGDSNEIEENRGKDNYSVVDRGLKNYLELEAMANQDRPLDEMLDLVMALNDDIALAREKRISAIVANAANYGGNTSAVANNWNGATGGDVIPNLLAARSAIWSGKGATQKIGFCGIGVWNTGIANNPALRDLFKYTREGLVTKAIASHFGLDDILVGRAWEDTANHGQAESISRILSGDVFGVLAVASRPTVRSAHFGSTFRTNGSPLTTEWYDPSKGVRGGIYARVAVSEDHKVVAPDAGYLLTSALT